MRKRIPLLSLWTLKTKPSGQLNIASSCRAYPRSIKRTFLPSSFNFSLFYRLLTSPLFIPSLTMRIFVFYLLNPSTLFVPFPLLNSIHHVPSVVKSLLFYLMQVSANSSTNMMHADNLSIVFGEMAGVFARNGKLIVTWLISQFPSIYEVIHFNCSSIFYSPFQ